MTSTYYDIVICGGGLVGGGLACALRALPFKTLLLDAGGHAGTDETAAPDPRIIALSYVSKQILYGLGLWQDIAPYAAPIQHIHVSERGRFGFTRLSNRDLGTEALGYVVPAMDIARVLYAHLGTQNHVVVQAPARLLDWDKVEEHLELRIQYRELEYRIQTRLLVAADGTASPIRESLGLPVHRRNYHQYALTAKVGTTLPHQNTAFERFSKNGPLALLPLHNGECALIWTLDEKDLEAVMSLDNAAFLKLLQERFGTRLGRFISVGPRSTYPLGLMQARKTVQKRIVVIGNAAHTLHPVAGQGLNLGLRDTAALAELLTEAAREECDPGAPELLHKYAAQRRQDTWVTAGFTDALIRVFSNNFLPLALLRNTALTSLDLCPPLKYAFLRRGTGLSYADSRLARGLPLDGGTLLEKQNAGLNTEC